MAFVNAETLRRIFGGAPVMQQGAFDPSTPQGQQMIAMLAGAGLGMTQASAQPGANFAQALGGGAGGMMQGQHQHQQRQYMQAQMEHQQAQMEAARAKQAQQAALQKGIMDLITGGSAPSSFAAEVDTGPMQGADATPMAPRGQIASQPLGSLSAQFESAGRPDSINPGTGDPGGASYGRHQLSSNAGTLGAFFESPEGQAFATQFGDLEPGSEGFNQVWREVSNDERVGQEFAQAQQQFIERTHIRPNLERGQRVGLAVDNPGVAEALASMGVQHSGAGNLQMINEAAARVGPDATPAEQIDALYDVRSKYVENLPESGPNGIPRRNKDNILNRYREERVRARQLAQAGQPQQGLPPQAEAVLGAQQPPQQQQPQNSYQAQAQAQGQGGLFSGLPPETQRFLGLMAMNDPASVMPFVQQQLGLGGQDDPARVREAQIIAQQTGRPVGEVLAEMRGLGEYAQGPQLSAAEAEIGRLMSIGLSEEQAIKYQSGLLDARTNEVTGRIVLTDMSNPDRPVVTEIPIAAPSGVTEGETPRETLYGAAEGRLSTGVWGAIQEWLGRTVGQLPVGGIGEEATEVRQQLRTAQNDIIRALSINPRFPIAEMERIRREIDISPSLFDSPESLQARMRSVDSSLRTRLATERRVANDPNRSPAQREAADAAIEHIEAFLRVLGVPQEGETLGRGPGAESGLTAPPGWEDDWDYLTPEEQQSLLQQSGGN